MKKPDISFTECRSVWSQVKNKNKQIQLKRRWLLGLSTSKAERKKLKRDNILETRSLPESLIREDDIFFHTMKSRIEENFGIRRPSEVGHEVVAYDLEYPIAHDIKRVVLSHIDNFAIGGLSLLVEILIGTGTKFDKTRKKMKRIIRESLLVVYGTRNPNGSDNVMEISRKISEFLNNPQNFQDNRVPFSTSRSMMQRANVKRVLEDIENLPLQSLIAMHKKLKEVKQATPQLQPKKSGFNRSYLINEVKKKSSEMLHGIGNEDQLPVPLAKAMEVASLSQRLKPGFCNSSATEFEKFYPEMETLRDEIIKAIWSLETKIGMPALESVKNMLDPSADVSARSLRPAIRKLLTEYLFWCSDMDSVPKTLFQILAAINTNSQGKVKPVFNLRNAIDEEVECVLNLSAHTKQNLLDLLPEDDFDADFTDAYMEDSEDSDDEADYVDKNCYADDAVSLSEDDISRNSSLSDGEIESSSGSVPFDSEPPTGTNGAEETPVSIYEERSKPAVFVEEFDPEVKRITYKNKYIAVQEVCDEASMVMRSHICRLLEEFGRKKGLDLKNQSRHLSLNKHCVNKKDDSQEQPRYFTEESDAMTMIRVTEELMPSFPKSGIEKLRKLLGS